MKFAANLHRLWAELPYLDRFEAAAESGFEGVSVPFPYDMAAKETKRAMLRSGLPVVQITAPPPNYTGGARGFAAVPGLEARFQYDLRRALRYCQELRVPVLHIMAGQASGPDARTVLMENLSYASAHAPAGIMLTIEPQAQEGAFLNNYAEAAALLDELNLPNLGLQFHSQHAQILGGDAVRVFQEVAPFTRHIQLADAPGGGSPGSGIIEFLDLMEAIRAASYTGWVVADHVVEGATEESLASFMSLRT